MTASLIHAWPLPVTEIDFVWALVISAFLGAMLGLERSVAGKHAGMRTYALVSLGSCLFAILGTLASLQLGALFPGVNPLQLAGSVIIGIGFIGSGLSLLRGDHPVELTTATGIWVAAGVGMACGFGFYLLALVATVLALAIFTLFLRVENSIRAKYGTTLD
ncbi:MAG TPA: MgtC/SapB family protein [Candidatus Paceibacterota bacterium]|nr:MgtC/SapB family protein [Candidatus Paceibacterota bacterium]